MPNETPRPERMSIDDRQRSHWANMSAVVLGAWRGSADHLFVEESFAHGARGRRKGCHGLGGVVGHCGSCVRAIDGVEPWRRAHDGMAGWG